MGRSRLRRIEVSTKAQRIEKVWQRAYEYARSGRYTGYMAIERVLCDEGLHEARGQLDDKHVRDELDGICRAAQAAVAAGLTYTQAIQQQRCGRAEPGAVADPPKAAGG